MTWMSFRRYIRYSAKHFDLIYRSATWLYDEKIAFIDCQSLVKPGPRLESQWSQPGNVWHVQGDCLGKVLCRFGAERRAIDERLTGPLPDEFGAFESLLPKAINARFSK